MFTKDLMKKVILAGLLVVVLLAAYVINTTSALDPSKEDVKTSEKYAGSDWIERHPSTYYTGDDYYARHRVDPYAGSDWIERHPCQPTP